ncbi:MAG TPA: hypothetical protein VK158_02845 [Acidobacteriota bacterium]|nr:hypothetical protein [Acidobacteriota bacterium]
MIKRAYIDATDLSTYNNMRNLVFEILNQTPLDVVISCNDYAKVNAWPEKLNQDFDGRVTVNDEVPTESVHDDSGIYIRALHTAQFPFKKTKREIIANLEYLKFTNKKPTSDVRITELGELLQTNKPVVVFGSICMEEYKLVADTAKLLQDSYNIVIAPRLLETSSLDELCGTLIENQITLGMKSSRATFKNNKIILLDTVGELVEYYGIGAVNVIGGGFGDSKHGSHNPLESLVYSVPTIIGKSHDRQKKIVDAFKESSLLIAQKTDSSEDLVSAIHYGSQLLSTPRKEDILLTHSKLLESTSQITRQTIQDIVDSILKPTTKR